jgi:hypothetical protein
MGQPLMVMTRYHHMFPDTRNKNIYGLLVGISMVSRYWSTSGLSWIGPFCMVMISIPSNAPWQCCQVWTVSWFTYHSLKCCRVWTVSRFIYHSLLDLNCIPIYLPFIAGSELYPDLFTIHCWVWTVSWFIYHSLPGLNCIPIYLPFIAGSELYPDLFTIHCWVWTVSWFIYHSLLGLNCIPIYLPFIAGSELYPDLLTVDCHPFIEILSLR